MRRRHTFATDFAEVVNFQFSSYLHCIYIFHFVKLLGRVKNDYRLKSSRSVDA